LIPRRTRQADSERSKRKPQTTRGFNTDAWRELRFDIDEAVQPDVVGTLLDMTAVASRVAG